MIQLNYTTPNTQQSVYISTEDNRIDKDAIQLAFLFEITNDMSESVVYAYLLKINVLLALSLLSIIFIASMTASITISKNNRL